MNKMIEIEAEKLQQLVKNFYRLSGFCDELDIYEHDEMDNSLQEMEEWVNETFGRDLEKL